MHLKLVSFELCPYVDRSRIVLLEKGVPHDVAFIDLEAPPAWFLAVSPTGRVPLLLADDRPIFESMVINEFIEDLHPSPPLLPRDPVDRAVARSWIVFANDEIMPSAYEAMVALAGGAGGDALARPIGELRDALARLEPQVARAGGPFFLGRDFSLADAAYAPFFRRWRVAERWDDAARLLSSLPAVSAWADALLARPSVAKAEPRDFAARTKATYAARAARNRA